MPETLTPVGEYSMTEPSIPLPGELGGMQTGPAPMKPVLQKAFDRAYFAMLATSGVLSWSGDFSVDPGGSASSFTLRIGAIQSVPIAAEDGTSHGVYSYAGGSIGAAKIEGGGNLAGDTWYYVYAIPGNAGAIDFEISDVAPRAHRVFKSPANTATYSRRYLACFRTDSTGAPFPMRMVRGRCLYRRGGIASVTGDLASDGLRALTGTNTHALTSLDLSSRLPPHARVAIVSGEIVATSSGSSGTAALNLYTADDTTSIAVVIAANASNVSGDTSRNSALAEIETTSAQAIGYSVTNSTGLDAYSLDVLGWCE